MSRILLFVALLALAACSPEKPVDSVGDFKALRDRARQMGETSEGQAYEQLLAENINEATQAALKECTKIQSAKPPYTIKIVIKIGAEGKVLRVVPEPEQPVSDCMAQRLSELQLPAPPEPDWLVLYDIFVGG